MNKVKIIEKYIETDKLDDDVTIVSLSDLHLWLKDNRMIGVNNVEEIIKVLSTINYDYMLIPGDLINDCSDLFDKKFKNEFLQIMRMLTNNHLTFYSLGNHDIMTMGENSWEASSEILLKNTLEFGGLDNMIYLDRLNGFSLNNSNLVSKGFPTCNINVIGAHMPFSFYDKQEKESDEKFLEHWKKFGYANPCNSREFNILLLHSLRNFINISKEKGKILLLGLDMAVGGHYHNGTIPNYLSSIIPGNFGLLNPQMQILQKYERGCINIGNVPCFINGYTNFRVENELANKVFGGPQLLLIHLVPKKNKIKKRI